MTTKITRRAVEVVLEMLPKPGVAGVDLNSQAFEDIVRELGFSVWEAQAGLLCKEIQAVLSALGRGEFSVLDLSLYE